MKVKEKKYLWKEDTAALVLKTIQLLKKHKDYNRLQTYLKEINLKTSECINCKKETYTLECEVYKICTDCLKDKI